MYDKTWPTNILFTVAKNHKSSFQRSRLLDVRSITLKPLEWMQGSADLYMKTHAARTTETATKTGQFLIKIYCKYPLSTLEPRSGRLRKHTKTYVDGPSGKAPRLHQSPQYHTGTFIFEQSRCQRGSSSTMCHPTKVFARRRDLHVCFSKSKSQVEFS